MIENIINNLTEKQLREVIVEIEALDLATIEIDLIKEMLIPLFKGYILSTPRLPPGIQLYRGRKCTDRFNFSSELSYPPAESCKKNGRVNRAGQTLFYCCTAKEGVFFELNCIEGETLAVSRWKTTAPLLLNNVGYTKQTFQSFNSNRECPNWGDQLKAVNQTEKNQIIREFLASEFTRIVPKGQEHLYKLSIAIAEKHYEFELFDGLLYPTVQMKANADNIALKPQYVEDHLLLERVEFYQVDKVTDSGFGATPIDIATTFGPEGAIEWKGRRGHWVLKPHQMVTATSENGHWVVRDEQGNIIDPE